MDLLKQLKQMLIHFDFTTIYHQKTSKTLGRVFTLFLILLLIISTKFYFDFSGGFSDIEKAMTDSPYFTIREGSLNFEAPQPYYPVPGDDSFIVDTTGSIEPSILEGKDTGFLITKDKAHIRSSFETRTVDLIVINQMAERTTVTRNDITSWILGLKPILYIIFVFVISAYHLAAKAISMLILSFLLMVTASVSKKSMKYSAIFNVSAYVLLLPILFYWLRDLASVYIPFFSLFYWAVAIVYGYMGVSKYRDILEPVLPYTDNIKEMSEANRQNQE